MNNEIARLMQSIIPAGMEQAQQFITYNLVSNPKFPEKPDKMPCDARGWNISAFVRTNWMPADLAVQQMLTLGGSTGLGFVLSEVDRFWCIDLDKAFDPATGKWSQLALDVYSHFPGCAVEVSLSGTGLHLFGIADVPPHRKKVKLSTGEIIEFYTESRFIALTGKHKAGNALIDYTAGMPAFIERFGLTPDPTDTEVVTYTSGIAPGCNPVMDDAELIRRMCDSAGSKDVQFGRTAHPRDLWLRNVEALARFYPPIGKGEEFDGSEADLALAGRLYYYTGDIARTQSLFLQSGIARPAKYAARPYLMTRLLTLATRGPDGRTRTQFYDREYRSSPQAPMPQPLPGMAPMPPQDPRAVAAASWGAPQVGYTPLPTLRDFSHSYTLNEIMAMDLPEPVYLVEATITPGTFLLVGKPKKGKSWMMLDLALNVAVGGHFLGRKCRQGRVIYFALEDNRRRIKARMREMCPASFTLGTDQLQILTLEDKVEGMDRGFFDSLRHTLMNTTGHALVIVDTLSKVRFSKKGNENLYEYDRRSIDPFTNLCGEFPNLTVMIVHHARKNDSDDPGDLASGTLGLTGAADGSFILAFDVKNQTMVLHGNGRDIDPMELAVKLEMPRWVVLGDPDTVGMSDTQHKIVEYLAAVKVPVTMTDIINGTDLDKSSVQGRLATLLKHGKVLKERKLYMLAGS